MNHSQCVLGDIQTKAEGALALVNLFTGLLSASYILLKLKTVPCQEISFRKNCFLVLFFFPLAALTFEEQRLPARRSAIIKTKGKNHHNQLSTTIRLWGMSLHCFGEHR